jgi:hypothetical protein
METLRSATRIFSIIKSGEILDQLNDCHLKKDPLSMALVV